MQPPRLSQRVSPFCEDRLLRHRRPHTDAPTVPPTVLSDPQLRRQYNDATAFDVECMPVEEYLARFKYLILTVNGLGVAEETHEPVLTLTGAQRRVPWRRRGCADRPH